MRDRMELGYNCQYYPTDHWRCTCTLRGIRRRLANPNPNPRARARAPGHEILTTSGGNPATKNHDILLILGPRIGKKKRSLEFLVQQSCISCVTGAPNF